MILLIQEAAAKEKQEEEDKASSAATKIEGCFLFYLLNTKILRYLLRLYKCIVCNSVNRMCSFRFLFVCRREATAGCYVYSSYRSHCTSTSTKYHHSEHLITAQQKKHTYTKNKTHLNN